MLPDEGDGQAPPVARCGKCEYVARWILGERPCFQWFFLGFPGFSKAIPMVFLVISVFLLSIWCFSRVFRCFSGDF